MPTLRESVPLFNLRFSPLDSVPAKSTGAVIGAGWSFGSAHDGAENGPYFLRTLSKAHTWSASQPSILDLRSCDPLVGLVDVGDLDFGCRDLGRALTDLSQVVCALPPDTAPCVIGGDHTVSLAVVRALASRRTRPFTVVQFDHHLDLQIWRGQVDGDGALDPVFNTNVMSHISDVIGRGRLVQVGVGRFVTIESDRIDAVREYLTSVGKQICVTAPEIDIDDAVADYIGPGEDVYLTVDVDVLSENYMSSTGYPAAVGLSPARLLRLIDLVLAQNTLIGCDVVEFAAPRDARDAKTLGDGARGVLILLHLLSHLSAKHR